MNYFFDFSPIQQVSDSTQSSPSFIEQTQQSFIGQSSIMSADFENNTIDSLVKIKTITRRVRKKKVIKSYKHLDSYLIVKKDQFTFLKSIQKPLFQPLKLNDYILENNIYTPVYKSKFSIEKRDSTNNYESQDSIIQQSVSADSTMLSIQSRVTEEYTYQETVTSKNNFTEKTKPSLSGEFWIMGILLFVLLLAAFIKMQFNSKLKSYTQALLSYQFFFKIYKEQNIINQRLALLLSVLFYISISLVFYYTFFYIFPINQFSYSIVSYVSILIAILFTVIIFSFVNRVLSTIFEVYDLINEYLYNLYFIHRFLGLVLLPIVVLYPYLPPIFGLILMYLAWGVILLSFIIRWFRGVTITFKHRVPYFYMILYLCTLEIIPLMFIIKKILSLY